MITAWPAADQVPDHIRVVPAAALDLTPYADDLLTDDALLAVAAADAEIAALAGEWQPSPAALVDLVEWTRSRPRPACVVAPEVAA